MQQVLGVSELQARAVLDLQLRRLTPWHRDSLREEPEEKSALALREVARWPQPGPLSARGERLVVARVDMLGDGLVVVPVDVLSGGGDVVVADGDVAVGAGGGGTGVEAARRASRRTHPRRGPQLPPTRRRALSCMFIASAASAVAWEAVAIQRLAVSHVVS
ncbi:hypothetical protein [Amycolatopsis methanolica]|uniref:Uncharacterized protein n=1 Tax=Amycolatopsis methanolica 239 TaxID=1068978 RepID=A0A076MZE9_AMYME|nr:hypothetical protein [Amycolatopsis methanolica]AIJ26003.1 hypothetical protein AMETH_5911 [Amycolatopsis methanolica 239]